MKVYLSNDVETNKFSQCRVLAYKKLFSKVKISNYNFL